MTIAPEASRIVDELTRAFDGDCWHGSPLKLVLKGITAQQAAAKHPQLTHSIWALLKHLAAWVEVVRLRVTENRAILTPDAGDFPAVTETSEQAWKATLDDFDLQHRKLVEIVARLDAAQLDATVPGKNYPVAVMLHGTSQHYAYHAGQIALLKKLSPST